MYISKINIRGIGCFENVSIDFTSNNDVIKVATILGDNGTGKTTIIRCIAMGLCDRPGAVGLLQELYGDWINHEKKEGVIHIEFLSNSKDKNSKSPFIKRTFEKTEYGNIEIKKDKTWPDPFPWDDIFVCGYGAARSAVGTKDYREYSSVDSVYTLFNYDSPLQNSELIIRRIKEVIPLIDLLYDKDPKVRIRAATALGEIKSEKAVNPLITLLKDQDTEVRISAITALGGIKSENVVDNLIALLKDKESKVRISVINALGKIKSEWSIGHLIDLSKDKDIKIRISAITALGNIKSARVVEPLIDSLNDENTDVRVSAIMAVAMMKLKKAVEPLRQLSNDENPKVRGTAKRALEFMFSGATLSDDTRSEDTVESNQLLKRILNWIDHILMLPNGSTELGKSGITISGPWGKFMPLTSLGDGYRATVTLISDMLGWALFYDEIMFYKDIIGIVLLDEIEQHLHPSWQRKVIKLFQDMFPKIQFIITTHSPLVASNAGKLHSNDTSSKLFHLKFEGKNSQLSEVEENISELDLNQILSSEAFDFIFDVNPQIKDILQESSELAAKDNRTDEEENTLNKFKSKLKELMFPPGRTLIERIVEREYYQDLEKKVEEFQKILKGRDDKNQKK